MWNFHQEIFCHSTYVSVKPTQAELSFSEQHLLVFLGVQLFSQRPGCMSTHRYTCVIYPRSYNINFTGMVATCLRIWIQRLSITFSKSFFVVYFSEKDGSRKNFNIFKSSFRIITLLIPTCSACPTQTLSYFPCFLLFSTLKLISFVPRHSSVCDCYHL